MGGFGSGGWQNGKRTTTNLHALDIRQLQRAGLLTPGRTFSWRWTRSGKEVASIQARTEIDRVNLNYRIRSSGDEGQLYDYPVLLEWTACNLGGRRVWFRCPAQGCRRRVAMLFGGPIFACRHCHRLVYQCQRETDADRATRRANNIRQRLGWDAGILNPARGKPKGMHWLTFERLAAAYVVFANESLERTLEGIALHEKRFAKFGLDPINSCFPPPLRKR